MTPAERIMLLAAAASPLEGPPWRRADLPAGLPPQLVDGDAVGRLLGCGLLDPWQGQPGGQEWIELSQGGRAEAGTLRDALGSETRQLLRRIAEAGELVRRSRPKPGSWDGAAYTEAVITWHPPTKEYGKDLPACADELLLLKLANRGLVVLLAGGTRALLTGAGQWCAAKAPSSDSKPGVTQGATGDATGPETASEGCCGPGKAVSR